MKLTINERELEFKLGIGFLGELIEETGKSIQDVLEGLDKNPYKYIPLAMFVSAKYALERKGQELTFTKSDFIDWLEADGGISDANKSAITFIQELTKDLTKDVPKDDAEDLNSEKKTLIGQET